MSMIANKLDSSDVAAMITANNLYEFGLTRTKVFESSVLSSTINTFGLVATIQYNNPTTLEPVVSWDSVNSEITILKSGDYSLYSLCNLVSVGENLSGNHRKNARVGIKCTLGGLSTYTWGSDIYMRYIDIGTAYKMYDSFSGYFPAGAKFVPVVQILSQQSTENIIVSNDTDDLGNSGLFLVKNIKTE